MNSKFIFGTLTVITTVWLVSGVVQSALAKEAKVNVVRTTGGNAVEFPNVHLQSGMGRNLLQPFNEELQTTHDIKSADRAQRMMERNSSALTGLLINKGRIVFEGYREPARRNSKMHSMSMSKSLTALVIGNLYCDGKINSLDDKAVKYAPQLEGTPYGDTSIRNLLMMASGIKKLGNHGQPKHKTYVRMRNQQATGLFMLKGHTRQYEEGTNHLYNSGDTLALSQVMESMGGLVNNFNFYIWSRIGTETGGSWMVDKQGQPIAFAGFNASLRDWGKLGMYTIDMVKGRGGSCMQEFATDMNSKQIRNERRPGEAGRTFSHYGYQTWIMDNGNAWWVGYGGQRVGLNFELEKVMVVHSYIENYMTEAHDVFNYFADWD